MEEGELSDQDPDATVTDPEKILSEEQNYRETMRGIRSYMGWSHIPDMDIATSSAEDNPLVRNHKLLARFLSVACCNWLCNKMKKLNCYPSHSSETSGLLKDQCV